MQRSALELAKEPVINLDMRNRSALKLAKSPLVNLNMRNRSALELAKAPLINLDRRNRTCTQVQQIHGSSFSPSPLPGPVVVRKKRQVGTPGPVTIITAVWDDNASNKFAVQRKQRVVLPITSLRNSNEPRVSYGNVVVAAQRKRLTRGPNLNGFRDDEDEDISDSNFKDKMGKQFGKRIQGSSRKEDHYIHKQKFHKQRLVGGPITGFWKDDNISKDDLDNDLDMYMAGSSEGGLSRGSLDQDLETYMKARAPKTMANIAGKDAEGYDDEMDGEGAKDELVLSSGGDEEVTPDVPMGQENDY